MLTIQCTKKLTAELSDKSQNLRDIIVDPLYSWHAHLFLFNRRKCVLVMNNMTRYNFVLFGLKKVDFNKFENLVLNEIAKNLKADHVDGTSIQRYLDSCDPVSITSTSDRSIISQMNEMITVSKYKMEDDKQNGIEPDMFELNRYLNRFVMLKLPEAYSGKTMRNSIHSLYK